MELDWFTLLAQVVNFLVLVALLRHVFYSRIIAAMDAREADIAGRLDEAARARAAAMQEAEAFRARNRELDEQRDQILARAADEAGSSRQQLVEEARRDIGELQKQWLAAMQRERAGLLQDFRERLGQGVFALAGKGLRELADADLEAQVVKVFIQRLATTEPAERDAIIAAVRGPDREIEVRTAFPLSVEARETLARSLRRQLGDDLDLRFATDPALICGIELHAHSHRLGWNLDSYLESMEAQVFEALDQSARDYAAGK